MSWIITEDDTGTTALDATTVTGLSLDSVFIGETVENSFRLGNTGNDTAEYTFSASGVNTEINDDVEFSLDRNDWDSTLTVSGVQPNRLTERIYYRLTPDDDDYEDTGTFLIRVDEV